MSRPKKYESRNGHIEDFGFYQAINGKICLRIGSKATPLTLQQINDLEIDVYALEDYSHDDFLKAYGESLNTAR